MIWCWQLWPLMLRNPFLEAPWTLTHPRSLTPSLTRSHWGFPKQLVHYIYHLVWSEQSSRVMKDYMYTAAAAVGFLQLGAAAADSSDINLMVSGSSLTHYSLTHSLTHSNTNTPLLTHSPLIYIITQSINQSITYLHTLSHTLTHTLTHSLIHSLTDTFCAL
jgi:hypothetical protein